MKNTDLFSFQFVNRDTESLTIEHFISKRYECNVLWVTGRSGVGKSFLLEHHLLQKKDRELKTIFVTIRDNETKHGEYLLRLLDKMNIASVSSLYRFVKTHYASIVNIAGHKLWEKYTHGKDQNSMQLLIESAYFIHEEKQTKTSLSRFLCEYFISEFSSHILVLDNLTAADTFSMNVIKEFLLHISSEKKLSIIVTTNTDHLDRNGLDYYLTEELPHVYISMKPFDKADYFKQILKDKFNNIQLIDDNVNRIFELCEGYPQKLRGFLRSLYIDDGINMDGSKAVFLEKQLFKYLFLKKTGIDLSKLTSSNVLILRILVLARIPINKNFISSLLNYMFSISDINDEAVTSGQIGTILIDLWKYDIIEPVNENGHIMYRFTHDALYEYLLEHFLSSGNTTILVSSAIIGYVVKNKNQMREDGYSESQLQQLLALHSFLTQDKDQYVQYNKEYAINLSKKQQYIEAVEIFQRLSNDLNLLNSEEILVYAHALYESGGYEECLVLMQKTGLVYFDPESLVITGKCEFILVRPEIAINYYNEALDRIDKEKNPLLYVEINNLKQMALTETENGYEKAKALFEATADFIKSKKLHHYKLSRFYRNALNIYTGEQSLTYLNNGACVAKECDDDIEYAKAIHNLGFEKFRQGDMSGAEDDFNVALRILENSMIHETAYPLNNIGVCLLSNGFYNKAKEYLDKARILVTSGYGKLVIEINSCINCVYCDNEATPDYESIIDKLNKDQIKDPRIHRKIYLNYAIYLIGKRDYQSAADVLNMCLPQLKRSRMIHRWNRYASMVSLPKISAPDLPLSESAYYRDIAFEPWMLTYGHD